MSLIGYRGNIPPNLGDYLFLSNGNKQPSIEVPGRFHTLYGVMSLEFSQRSCKR